MSEQRAAQGPYVNRRVRRGRSIFLSLLRGFLSQQQTTLPVAIQHRQQNRNSSDVKQQQKTQEIHVDPLSQALTLYCLGSLRQRKAEAPPTATAPLHPITLAKHNPPPNHPPSLSLTPLSLVSVRARATATSNTQHTPLLNLDSTHASTAFHRFTPYGGAWSSVFPTQQHSLHSPRFNIRPAWTSIKFSPALCRLVCFSLRPHLSRIQ